MTAAKYINRELLATFAVTLLVLFAVAVGGRFIGYLQEAAAGKYAADGLLTIMGLRLPGFLQLICPFAFYIALLLTLGRMHAEQEMAVLQSCGVGIGRLLVWILAPVALLAGAVAYLSFAVTPANNAALDRFVLEQRIKAGFDRLQPGLFQVSNGGRRVTYAESLGEDRRTLNDLFISEYDAAGDVATIWAKRGEQYLDEATGSRFLVLEEGTRLVEEAVEEEAVDEGIMEEGIMVDEAVVKKAGAATVGQGGRLRQLIRFASLSQKIDAGAAPRRSKEEALPTASLWRRGDAAAAAELHWRLALPIFCLISCLIACAVAPVKPRQGRFGRIVPGVLIMLGYYLALLANQNALVDGRLPAALGLWPAHAPFAGVAAALAWAARPAVGQLRLGIARLPA